MQGKKMEENKIRVQDDLYQFVNGEWLDTAVIPNDRPTVGGFSDLEKKVEELLINDLNEMSKGNLVCPNKNVEKAVRLYKMVNNVKKKNKQGIKPILKTLKLVNDLKNISALNRNLKKFVMMGMPLPFSINVEINMKDTDHHSLMIMGPSTILPDTTYYKEGMEAQKNALFGLWTNMATQVLAYTPLLKEEQEQYIKDTIAFDTIIASLVKSSQEWSEYTKMYNPMKSTRVGTLLKPIKYKKLLLDLFGQVPEETIVADPRFIKGFKTLFNEDNFDLYKHWAYVKELLNNTGLLSEELRDIGTSFGRALTGTAAVMSVDKFAYHLASNYLSEPIGLYYGEKYFGEEAKQDVVDMVKDIIDTYKKRIKDNDFLVEETKEKAILKLDKMAIKMGYPDKCDELYDKIDFDDNDSLFAAVSKIRLVRAEDEISKLFSDVDRTKWGMPGHMVNASYNPFTNTITFPAAILQAPFYSIKQNRSQNLGGIGAVIGHEISHAFDNNGAQCDEKGNINNWWTKEDFKRFKAKTAAMIKQFDGIDFEGGKINGTLVVSENIADNGGMAVTLDIMSRTNEAKYDEYFYNWAKVWCMKAKPEYTKLLMAIDVHSPNVLRANIQPRNFEEWYNTFKIKKTDKMYIAPNKRIHIW